MPSSLTTPTAIVYPKALTINCANYDTVVSGSWTRNAPAATYMSSRADSASATINDQITWKNQALASGTYTVRFMSGLNYNAAAKAHILLGSTDIATMDMYNAGSVNNVLTDVTGVVIVGGIYDISLKLTDKNASSSGYNCVACYIQFIKTA
jgi:hypothetical protein